jgi:hypothetical protein
MTSIADKLYALKLFAGTGTNADGTPIYELNRSLTRIEALAIVIRLLGLESQANTFTGLNPFTDVPSWADRTAAFAYSQGITVGVNSAHTLFNSNGLITPQEFTAFLLRVLGYSEKNGDFAFAQTLNKAVETGLYSGAELQFINSNSYIRGYVVANMADTLLALPKNSQTRLIDQLVSQNVLTREAADKFIGEIAQVYIR